MVLALDSVSERLGTRRSGVLEVRICGGAEVSGDVGCAEPRDDAKDEAEAIASALIVVQPSPDCFLVMDDVVVCSRELDLRSD